MEVDTERWKREVQSANKKSFKIVMFANGSFENHRLAAKGCYLPVSKPTFLGSNLLYEVVIYKMSRNKCLNARKVSGHFENLQA